MAANDTEGPGLLDNIGDTLASLGITISETVAETLGPAAQTKPEPEAEPTASAAEKVEEIDVDAKSTAEAAGSSVQKKKVTIPAAEHAEGLKEEQ